MIKFLETLTNSELVHVYNTLSQRPVKKFTDKITAVARVKKILEDNKKTVWRDTVTGELVIDNPQEAPKKKPRKNGQGNRSMFEPHMKITVLVDENPKRKNTKSFIRFALYKTGMTVAEYTEAAAEAMGDDAKLPYQYLADLHWDTEHNFVSVS